MPLLDDAQRKRIEAKIGEVEARTAGEIVVATVPRSASYGTPRLLYAALLGFSCSAALWQLAPELAFDWVLFSELPFTALFWALLGVPSVLRLLVRPGELDRAVQERAARMFTERGVFDTRDHSGVLILLSELEHQVVILGDRGIHARVDVEGWQRHVRHIIEAIRAGKPADGICEVLEELGQVLADVFPRRPDDENELPDAVTHDPR